MKKIMFVSLAIALAVGFSAFTMKQHASAPKKFDDAVWYTFTGTDANNPNHYTLLGPNPPACNAANGPLCAIKAIPQGMGDPQPGQPDLGTIVTSRKKTP